jgi:2-amino-4-hydroxy-6-hydroxymethyldihydropteridine diphosphokinase
MECGFSLGSNLGDRIESLAIARDTIIALRDIAFVSQSRVYETEPVDVSEPHRDKAFLNAVIIIETTREPQALAAAIREIEDSMGRQRSSDKNAPRLIDVDLLYVETRIIETPNLTIPHPRWQERRFVVQPLADVRPDLVLPGDPRSVFEILLALPASPEVVLFAEDW